MCTLCACVHMGVYTGVHTGCDLCMCVHGCACVHKCESCVHVCVDRHECVLGCLTMFMCRYGYGHGCGMCTWTLQKCMSVFTGCACVHTGCTKVHKCVHRVCMYAHKCAREYTWGVYMESMCAMHVHTCESIWVCLHVCKLVCARGCAWVPPYALWTEVPAPSFSCDFLCRSCSKERLKSLEVALRDLAGLGLRRCQGEWAAA